MDGARYDDPALLELVERAMRGEQNAISDLIRTSARLAYPVAYGILQNRHDAEDAVSEAMYKVIKNLHRVETSAAYRGWLTTLTSRTAIDLSRRRARRQAREEVHEHVPETQAHDTDASDRLALREALAELTPEHRAVLLLRERDGYDYKEISVMLQLPLGTVKSRLAYARKALEKQLEIPLNE
ncbi:RNA polymerase sigma factor [Ferroacidibacillus organovorans]|uniref:RNA polymerase subunit sigma-24 n=1 Tax=Ferroacidibacillus organovorans TaxID=1765683 RepID=A0A162TRM9_9BACL|nr:RNA polymerase sigma factor [Ferroacidibacillus organovorans]KYP81061.1 hypothetical protein AYJ22_09020 [Ferroacidibacillus organovorans]OAG93689.1 hypothetical protein AYW79_09280 [Ferroacidibacillus organovorans]OPG17490.1 hypothetical protein B2M26_01820 [Ferroacidibacillus organovorans]